MTTTRYLAEVYVPQLGEEELVHAAARARVAAEELSAEGTPVRYLRSLFVPDDETCFWLYEACSPEAVGEATRRAAIECERVVRAVPIAAPDAGDCPSSSAGDC